MEFHEDIDEVIIAGLKFQRTCFACPEQYDVFDGRGREIGYVRLRGGRLSATYRPWTENEKTVHEHRFDDEWLGMFDTEEDREYHLRTIAQRLKDEIRADRQRRKQRKGR